MTLVELHLGKIVREWKFIKGLKIPYLINLYML